MKFKKSTPKSKSPLKQAPLRYAGQSVQEQINALVDEKVYMWLFIGAWAIALTVFEWTTWLFSLPRSPVLFTFVSIIVVGYCLVRLFRLARLLRNMKLGMDGEKAVGQYLDEKLAPLGYRIFHDLVFDEGFNIDHVLVGSGGIFCVETKTRSKPIKGQATVVYQGRSITVDSMKPDRDPIVQVTAAARSLRRLLEELTGSNHAVKPVLLFPGWFIENRNGDKDVWVLEPKAFVKFIENQQCKLDEKEIHSLSAFLKRHLVNEIKFNEKLRNSR